MNKRLQKKRRMYDQVIHLLAEHQPIWMTYVPFETSYNAFVTHVAELDELVESQLRLMKRHSELKHRKKKELIDEIVRCSSLLSAFAVETENPELKQELITGVSYWLRMSETNLLIGCERFITLLEENLSGLNAYGLDQTTVDELISLKVEFNTLKTKPRSKILLRTVYTEDIGDKVKAIDTLLREQLDKLVRAMSIEHETFGLLYFRSRKMIDYSSSHKDRGIKPPGRDDSISA